MIFRGEGEGALSYIIPQAQAWKAHVNPAPSKADLAVYAPTASAFFYAAKNREKADFRNWTKKEKAFAKVVRKEIELLRKMLKVLAQDIPAVATSLAGADITADDLKEKSVDDWIDAIRDEMRDEM